jgi:hypothetical protein
MFLRKYIIKNFDQINPLISVIRKPAFPLEHLSEFFEYLERRIFRSLTKTKKNIEKNFEKIEQEKKLKRLKDLETIFSILHLTDSSIFRFDPTVFLS